MSGQTIFVTGGNRGIGFELVKQFAAIPANTVIATIRTVEKSAELIKLAEELKNIKIVTLELASQESFDALEKKLPEVIEGGIDVLISNAGIGDSFTDILDAPREVYVDHYNINVLGTIFLTKILKPYLLKSDTRKIVFISSLTGQITDLNKVRTAAYGQSKAALNYTAKALSSELDAENFIVVPLHPGVVFTDMGQDFLDKGPDFIHAFFASVGITPVFSASSIIKVVDSLTRESNGKFFSYDGSELSY